MMNKIHKILTKNRYDDEDGDDKDINPLSLVEDSEEEAKPTLELDKNSLDLKNDCTADTEVDEEEQESPHPNIYANGLTFQSSICNIILYSKTEPLREIFKMFKEIIECDVVKISCEVVKDQSIKKKLKQKKQLNELPKYLG